MPDLMENDTKVFLGISTVVVALVLVWISSHAGWLDWLGNPQWFTAVATLATGVVLAVTAVLAIDGLKDARKTRHGELITDLSRRWDEPQIIKSQTTYAEMTRVGVEALVSKLYDANAEAATHHELTKFMELEAVPNLIETIGVLENLGAIDLDVVDALWGAAIRGSWSQWKAAVEAVRTLTGTPSVYVYFEQITTRLETRTSAQGGVAALSDPPVAPGSAGETGG